MPFASVILFQNDVKITATQSDFDGYVMFTALAPGKYNIQVSFIGFETVMLSSVIVSADKVTYARTDMVSKEVIMDCLVIISCNSTLIDVDVKSSHTVTRDEFKNFYCGCSRDIESACCEPSVDTTIDKVDGAALKIKTDSISTPNAATGQAIKLHCYPNPSSGKVFVESTKVLEELFLTDISGKILQRYVMNGESKRELDISEYPTGIYYIRSIAENMLSGEKVVVMH